MSQAKEDPPPGEPQDNQQQHPGQWLLSFKGIFLPQIKFLRREALPHNGNIGWFPELMLEELDLTFFLRWQPVKWLIDGKTEEEALISEKVTIDPIRKPKRGLILLASETFDFI